MILLDGIELPEGLLWQGDLDYCPIKQEAKPAITGRLVLNRGRMKDGRPIVLTGNQSAWITLGKLKRISELRLIPKMMHLNYHGTTYQVRWDYAQDDHFNAKPLYEHIDVINDDDLYMLETLKLIEVLD